jgi:ribosome-binding factor A
MDVDKRSKKSLRDLCAQPHEEDGLPPERERRRGNVHRDGQMLKLALREADFCIRMSTSPLLANVHVMGVYPAPDMSRLEIVVEASSDAEATRVAIAMMLGSIRAQLARSTRRKRTPELCVSVVPRWKSTKEGGTQ